MPETRGEIADPPSYSTIRALLRVLEEKGHLRHEQDGPRSVLVPTVPKERASANALDQVVRTFFDGSASQAMAALLDADDRSPAAPSTTVKPSNSPAHKRTIPPTREAGGAGSMGG